MIKSINLFAVVVFVIALLIAAILHTLYGNCQTSRIHYLVQCYYVPTNLPKWMWVSNYRYESEDGTKQLKPFNNYTGKWRLWFEEGGYSDSVYKNGLLDGTQVTWDINGNMVYEAEYKNGEINGKVFSKNETGITIAYRVNGVLNGKEIKWDVKGRKAIETNYINGEKNGKEIYYYDNGKVQSEANYLNGNRNGKYYEWFKNGSKKEDGYYKDGNLNGLITEWDVNGKKTKEQDWKDGEMIKDYLAPTK